MKWLILITGCFLIQLLTSFINNHGTISLIPDTSFPQFNISHIKCGPPSRHSAFTKTNFISEGDDHTEMKLITGGAFEMGSNEFTDSKPVHKVSVNSFWMDEHEVTNAQFAKFVKA